MNKKTKTIFWIVIAVVVVVVLAILFQQLISPRYTELSLTEFIAYVEDGRINYIYVNGYNWQGQLITNGVASGYYSTVGPSFYDAGGLREWLQVWNSEPMNLGVTVTLADPNAGSMWSSVFTLGSVRVE